PIEVEKAQGAYLHTTDGRKILDAVASWWVNPHGHSNPYIAKKVYEQMLELEHVIFAGFTHEPAVLLGERLLAATQTGHSRVFYADNGSTAVEVALKMALQYYHNQGEKKVKFIAFNDAFHGDTFGAMAVSGEGVFTHAFADMLISIDRIPVPTPGKEQESLNALQSILEKGETAAFIFEPLIQGAAGMIMYEADVLDKMIALCKANNVLTIADEVMTGFGRTGKMFATHYLENQPDIACYSKCLTGGALPMSATTASDEIFQAFWADDKMKTLMHGHSFTANPVGCAAALASLDLTESEETHQQWVMISEKHKAFIEEMKVHPRIEKARTLGTIMAIEIKTEEQTGYLNNLRDKLYDYFLERDILLRPLGNIVYILPPYCISEEDLDRTYEVIKSALRDIQ
ncbi:MAG: adenosylmethionine--8-amino-7-oxononanoate transaminase, partial [Schleiferiaceae bacterium]|nr:adenosylmethionine--8-amino-7-oxononanoate transaminase [Schleiferiaceae bacterium]